MEQYPEVYYLNGEFLIFNVAHALTLRRKRIIGQLIGSPTTPNQLATLGPPLILSHYHVNVILKHSFAKFIKLRLISEKLFSEENKVCYAEKLVELEEEARVEFTHKRSNELKRHNLEITPDRLKQFDEKKMKVIVPSEPCHEYSLYETTVISKQEVCSLLRVHVDRTTIFDDLYEKGFYISSGSKFGCDFLLYCGDPVRYHAKYAIRVVASVGVDIDMKELNYNEINALYRLCHTANKTAIFATINKESLEVRYWTLRLREYLTPESTSNIFVSITPSLNSI